MNKEYYFCTDVNESTWRHFTEQEYNNTLSQYYRKITGYGWKDKFAFNYNGDAFYISEQGKEYKGVWFEVNNRRIAVFDD